MSYRIAGKFGGQNVWRIYSFQAFGEKKVWRINRSAKGLSMVTTNLDGFSLANRIRFAKFAKLSPRQTFPLYGMFEFVILHSLCLNTMYWIV